MSLSIPEIIESLRAVTPPIPPDVLVRAETQLEAAEAEKQAEKADAPPKAKSQLVVIALDPTGQLAALGDLTALVVQIDENQDVNQTLPRLYTAVYEQRAAATKRIKAPIVTVADAAEGLKARFTKEVGLKIRTKTPVRVLVSDNTIPTA